MANDTAAVPLLRAAFFLLLYYLTTLGGLLLIMFTYPQSVDYLPVGGLDDLPARVLPFVDPETAGATTTHAIADLPGRAVALLSSLIGTLIFVWPVAWVYRRTNSGKQAVSLVETLFLLPIVVATVISIVQDSIALAFSLFGLVAAVRFRNTLKNPADAVYVFAALAVGLASGVSEIGIAGVGSLVFCSTALGLRLLQTVDR
jgi:hypothetical protein